MEDGLVLYVNPSKKDNCEGLNPYCNGRWSRTAFPDSLPADFMLVLILIVMEDGLVHSNPWSANPTPVVLILIVMEDGLVLDLIRLF